MRGEENGCVQARDEDESLAIIHITELNSTDFFFYLKYKYI